MRSHLRAVKDEAPRIDELLSQELSDLAAAERTASLLRASIAEHGRVIAKERGLAFIRFEHLKQEFGRP